MRAWILVDFFVELCVMYISSGTGIGGWLFLFLLLWIVIGLCVRNSANGVWKERER